jgi:CubicO group peptidase (beta-lactamase class C family)
MTRAALFLLAGAILLAQPRAALWTGERVKKIEAAVEAERVRQGIVGMTVSIARNGALRYSGAFGKADLENDVDARIDTRFRTASVCKPMTAVAALQLWERGRLDLDAPIQKYLPSYPEKPWTITTRMLLGHLSGTRAYRDPEMDSTRAYNSVGEALKMFSADPLLHQPRSKYLYSTYGYNVAGAVVEAAAGAPFVDFVRDNVLVPARMDSTRDDSQRDIIPHRTRGYTKTRDGRVVNAVLADTSNKIPGGGYVSTSDDLIRFALAWQQEKLLKRATMNMQTEKQKLLDGSFTGYGLGWNVSPVAGKSAISHSGSQHGTRTYLAMFPDLQLVIAVMTNSDFAEPVRVVELLVKEVEAARTAAKPR